MDRAPVTSRVAPQLERTVILFHARYVLPISAPPIEHGTVGVDNGRIAYVGPRTGAPAGEDEELGNALLMPGLVNAHCHLELTVMRGFLENLDFRSWILRLTTAKRAVLTREMLLDSALYGIDEGLRRGITTYADTCDSGVAFHAMRARGVRGIMYQEVFGPDPVQCEGSMAGLREKVACLRPQETPLVRVGVSPHAPYTVSDDLFLAVGEYAREESLPMAIHIAESELEQQLVVHGAGAFADGLRGRGISVAPRAESPIQLLASLGLLRAGSLLIHCVRVDKNDVSSIAAARCGIAHCPASNAKLGHGIAPLMELQRASVAVGLGSDSMASNNRMDILEEARLALLFQGARLTSPTAMSAAAGLELATLGGARAIGLDHEIGSLTVGKSADLAAFELRYVAPTFDPEAAAVFALGGTRATFACVAGRTLVRHGCLLDEDEELEARIGRTADLLRHWLSTDGRGAIPV
jgi:5-methylthioadenosine/S-adenosylhomocysteine deaminase